MASNYNKNLLKVKFFLPQMKKTVEFPAFITNLSDSFTSNWSSRQPYCLQDQIGVFRGTSRIVSFGLRIVAYSPEDAGDYQRDLNSIVMSLYPSYDGVGIPQNSPLLGIKIENIVHDNGGFLFGWLNGFVLTPNLSEGSFLNVGGNRPMIPNLWDLSFDFNVVHHRKPGFHAGNKNFNSSNFPVRIPGATTLKGRTPAPKAKKQAAPNSGGTTPNKTGGK